MNFASLTTILGQRVGEYQIKDGEYQIRFKSSDESNLKYLHGVLLLDNQSKPFPITIVEVEMDDDEERIVLTCIPFRISPGVVFKPTIRYKTHSYDLDHRTLDLFVKSGVASSKIIDKLLLCPECESSAFTIRPGCPSCGSHDTRPDQLVHHYACGNVDLLQTFTINKELGSIACGKCHKEGLLINVDYDVSAGLHRCMDCGWTGSNVKLIGRCLKCSTNFLVAEAKETTLEEYTLI